MAARKKKPVSPPPEPEVVPAAEPAAVAGPPPAESPPPDDAPDTNQRLGGRFDHPAFRGLHRVSLSDAPGGPAMRLLRSERYNQVAVQFDAKPVPPGDHPDGPRAYLDRVKAAGFAWRGNDGLHTKTLGRTPAERIDTLRAAEDFFYALANGIRGDRGLGPVRPGTSQER